MPQPLVGQEAKCHRLLVPDYWESHAGSRAPWCPSYRSGWFPEAYVKPLEEMPVNPMNPVAPMNSMAPMSPMNELPSRYLSWWCGPPRASLPLPSRRHP